MTKEFIFRVVCHELRVLPEKVLVESYTDGAVKKELVQARFWSMYFMKQILKESHNSIGLFFNNRNHSTVTNAIKKIDNQILLYAYSRDLYKRINLTLNDPERIMDIRLQTELNSFITKVKEIVAEFALIK